MVGLLVLLGGEALCRLELSLLAQDVDQPGIEVHGAHGVTALALRGYDVVAARRRELYE